MYKKIILHYDEIALKGGNRRMFEEKLVSNLNAWSRAQGFALRAQNSWGRIFMTVDIEAYENKIVESLRLFPGVSNFGIAYSLGLEDDEASLAEEFTNKLQGRVFRVTANRVNKNFQLTSQEQERMFAEKLFDSEPGLQVSMKEFDTELQIEILHKEKLFYLKERGLGGMPSGVSGKIVTLLSAGFDSPVASFTLQKRGAFVLPIHFHSREKTGREPEKAVRELAKILSKYQGKLDLALVSVFPIQKHISKKAKDKLRIVLLRRSFMRLATLYAKKHSALALSTGDSLAQVASQTLENISVVSEATGMPVLRPLIGMNKQEIINLSKSIDTHNISAMPCEDTCALFVPKKPETKANLQEVLEEERKLDLQNLEKLAIENMEIVSFNYGLD